MEASRNTPAAMICLPSCAFNQHLPRYFNEEINIFNPILIGREKAKISERRAASQTTRSNRRRCFQQIRTKHQMGRKKISSKPQRNGAREHPLISKWEHRHLFHTG